MKRILSWCACVLVGCGGGIIADTQEEEEDPSAIVDPPAGGGSPGTGGLTTGAGGKGGAGSTGKGGANGGSTGAGGTKPATGGSTGTGGTKPATGGSTGTGGSTATGGPIPTGSCTNPPPVAKGHATWYSITGSAGACGIPYASVKYYGAMNEEDFRASAACGACVSATWQGKTLNLMIIDLCPYQGNEQWCGPGGHHIDMSPDAFAFFRPTSAGVMDPITWKYVPCTITGGITYAWKAESSAYWAEVLIGNYPYEIAKVECQQGGGWVALTRTAYGYYQAPSGLGGGPYTFRITDINGSVVTDSGVPLSPGGSYQAPDNFGLCQ